MGQDKEIVLGIDFRYLCQFYFVHFGWTTSRSRRRALVRKRNIKLNEKKIKGCMQVRERLQVGTRTSLLSVGPSWSLYMLKAFLRPSYDTDAVKTVGATISCKDLNNSMFKRAGSFSGSIAKRYIYDEMAR